MQKALVASRLAPGPTADGQLYLSVHVPFTLDLGSIRHGSDPSADTEARFRMAEHVTGVLDQARKELALAWLDQHAARYPRAGVMLLGGIGA